MDNKIDQIYAETLALYGESHQLVKLTEECGELVQALCKYFNKKSVKNKTNVIEEMADVEILIAQIKLLFKDENQFNEVKKSKILRQKQRNIEEKDKRALNSNKSEPYEVFH
jgi:NTP pyrophosphatase (non-canonical NTP hydrolase)